MTSESTGYQSPCWEDVVPAPISILSYVNAITYGDLLPLCTLPLSVRTTGLNPGGAQFRIEDQAHAAAALAVIVVSRAAARLVRRLAGSRESPPRGGGGRVHRGCGGATAGRRRRTRCT